VGKATATALHSIHDVCGDSRLVPKDIRGSSETGTSERLAHFILVDLARTEGGSRTKLLYLTGDKNKDTLPNILEDGGHDLECLQVYETHGSPNFAGELECAVKGSNPGPLALLFSLHSIPDRECYRF
jgi:uroporphyrinogen-III synthase